MIVSVCVIAHNEGDHISQCVNSLLRQTFRDFEIIIVDDFSIDNTSTALSRIRSDQVRYFRNERRQGIPKSRNKCIRESMGRYLFFTDADCTASQNWVEEGVKALKNGCDGVEGRIIYVSEDYRPTFADNVVRNDHPGHFMTANVAYKRMVVERARGFDEKYTRLSDRNLGLRIVRQGGRICFSKRMVVYHSRKVWTVKTFVKSGSAIKNRVYLFKQFGDRENTWWRIVYPRSLGVILCPFSVIASLLVYSFRTWEDVRLLPFVYFRALYGRLCLWRECIREEVFLI